MRLIDADALKEEMKQRQESAYQWYSDAKAKEDEEIMVRADSAMVAFIECRLTIDNQPTIERKIGHWVEIGDEPYDEWECEVCGFVIDGSGCIDPLEYLNIYNFCPHCGAHMEGAEDEDRAY